LNSRGRTFSEEGKVRGPHPNIRESSVYIANRFYGTKREETRKNQDKGGNQEEPRQWRIPGRTKTREGTRKKQDKGGARISI